MKTASANTNLQPSIHPPTGSTITASFAWSKVGVESSGALVQWGDAVLTNEDGT
jgi:hypothetical protein